MCLTRTTHTQTPFRLVRYTCIARMRFGNQIMNKYHIIACKLWVIYAWCRCLFSSYSSSHSKSISFIKMLRFMGLCIVKHKVKKQIMENHVEKHLGNSDTEESRTKKKCLCFEVCALCLSSTMESCKLYMWQIWWNVDHIQRPVVLRFAISASSDWLHPTTIFPN